MVHAETDHKAEIAEHTEVPTDPHELAFDLAVSRPVFCEADLLAIAGIPLDAPAAKRDKATSDLLQAILDQCAHQGWRAYIEQDNNGPRTSGELYALIRDQEDGPPTEDLHELWQAISANLAALFAGRTHVSRHELKFYLKTCGIIAVKMAIDALVEDGFLADDLPRGFVLREPYGPADELQGPESLPHYDEPFAAPEVAIADFVLQRLRKDAAEQGIALVSLQQEMALQAPGHQIAMVVDRLCRRKYLQRRAYNGSTYIMLAPQLCDDPQYWQHTTTLLRLHLPQQIA